MLINRPGNMQDPASPATPFPPVVFPDYAWADMEGTRREAETGGSEQDLILPELHLHNVLTEDESHWEFARAIGALLRDAINWGYPCMVRSEGPRILSKMLRSETALGCRTLSVTIESGSSAFKIVVGGGENVLQVAVLGMATNPGWETVLNASWDKPLEAFPERYHQAFRHIGQVLHRPQLMNLQMEECWANHPVTEG